MERQITDGKPPEEIKKHCLEVLSKEHPGRKSFDFGEKFRSLLQDLNRLEFELLQVHIVTYLEARLKEHQAEHLRTAIADEGDDPEDGDAVIRELTQNDVDTKTANIKKAYGEPVFHRFVNDEVEKRWGKHRRLSAKELQQKRMLLYEERAVKHTKVGASQDVVDEKRDWLKNENDYGVVWSDLHCKFGGDAIVFVFVLSGE